MLLRSRETGRCFWFPRVAEPGTGCTDLEWVEASGEGTVYSTTVIRQKPPTPDYNLALIDLAEGPRMMSRVEGIAPEAGAHRHARAREGRQATASAPSSSSSPPDAGAARSERRFSPRPDRDRQRGHVSALAPLPAIPTSTSRRTPASRRSRSVGLKPSDVDGAVLRRHGRDAVGPQFRRIPRRAQPLQRQRAAPAVRRSRSRRRSRRSRSRPASATLR